MLRVTNRCRVFGRHDGYEGRWHCFSINRYRGSVRPLPQTNPFVQLVLVRAGLQCQPRDRRTRLQASINKLAFYPARQTSAYDQRSCQSPVAAGNQLRSLSSVALIRPGVLGALNFAPTYILSQALRMELALAHIASCTERSDLRKKYCRHPSTWGPIASFTHKDPSAAFGECFRRRASSTSEIYFDLKS